LREHIASGLTGGVGLFEGPTLDIDVFNIDRQKGLFKGYVDTSKAEINDVTAEIVAPIVKADSLGVLDERLSALTFGYLESIGVFHER
jgi:hypothetical protein